MYLYILKNDLADRYYIGVTKNLEKRIRQHNSLQNHYTGRIGGHWNLLFSRFFNSGEAARKEELRLKRAKNKKYISWYIKNWVHSSIGRATPS